jgi:hypothetical protein
MFIPDPNFYISDSGYLDPESASKNLRFFNPINCFQALGNISNIIRDVHPGSRFRIFPSRVPDPEPVVKRAPDPGSATLLATILHRKEPVPGVGPPHHLLPVEGADEHRLLLQ